MRDMKDFRTDDLIVSVLVNVKPEVKNLYFNKAKGITVVVWADKSITKVTCYNEDFDEEKGLAMCYMKKVLGNKGNFNNKLNKWLSEAIYQD